LQPFFITIGAPAPEVFHRGVTQLFLTQGLEKKCPGEAQLAALLCHELGRMVAEREALASPQTRNPERRPPMEVPFGNAGHIEAADQVRLAELDKFDKERRRSRAPAVAPDPKVLARLYLKNAGYPEAALEGVLPLLQEAQKNCAFETQLKSGPALPLPAWGPQK
jgi:hypothetical protein